MTDAWSILTPEEETRLRDRAARPANGSHFQITPPEARHNWPDPKALKSHLLPVKAFDPELLPDVLRDYVMDVSDRQQAPPDFAAVAGLCGIAAIAGNEVRIKPKGHDDWEIVPNIWGAIIGRPSAMKSPAMRAALAPVFALQDHARLDWETAKKEREIDAAMSEIGAKDAAREAARAMKAGDKERTRGLIAQHMDGEEDDAPCPAGL